MDKRDERRELVKALAVASYMRTLSDGEHSWISFDGWIEGAISGAHALLAALDQQSPPAQDADIPRCPRCSRALRPQLMGTLVCDSCGTTYPPQRPAGSATAAPDGEPHTPADGTLDGDGVWVGGKWHMITNREPKERVCVWTATKHTVGSGIYERRIYVTGCEDKRHDSREAGADFCKYCGGKIIAGAT